MQNAEGEGQI